VTRARRARVGPISRMLPSRSIRISRANISLGTSAYCCPPWAKVASARSKESCHRYLAGEPVLKFSRSEASGGPKLREHGLVECEYNTE